MPMPRNQCFLSCFEYLTISKHHISVRPKTEDFRNFTGVETSFLSYFLVFYLVWILWSWSAC